MASSCPCSDQTCQKAVPVSLGTSYLSEKSPSFYKNPREFFKKHLNEDRVFVCRFAMKPCVVLASNSLVKEILNTSSEETYNGLYDFFFGLFGDNILFADDLHVFQATLETVSDLAVSKHAILFVGGKIAVATPVRFATHHSHTIHQRFPDSRDTAIRICRCVTFTLTNQRIHDY